MLRYRVFLHQCVVILSSSSLSFVLSFFFPCIWRSVVYSSSSTSNNNNNKCNSNSSITNTININSSSILTLKLLRPLSIAFPHSSPSAPSHLPIYPLPPIISPRASLPTLPPIRFVLSSLRIRSHQLRSHQTRPIPTSASSHHHFHLIVYPLNLILPLIHLPLNRRRLNSRNP